ncbi:hypothetical protein A9Q86_13625 [Flavobacteriales bacterium 33_180_T64]|nr:hypothetical protein A9Q86_13625 [Flavobacteriales bacterium 33_180_T64]
MKKIFLLSFLMFSLFSCSLENDNPSFSNEAIPIESVTIPEEFQFGQVYQIDVTYFKPSGCHVFNGFLFENNANERTIILVNTVHDDLDCETYAFGTNEVEASFNYQVNDVGIHTFKFWQGKDDNGNDLYYIVDVPVIE